MNGSRSRAITLLTVAFVVGIALGGATLAGLARSGKADWIWKGKRPGTPSQNRQQSWATSLDQRLKLGLTTTQIGQMDSLRRLGFRATDSITKIWWPRIDSLTLPFRTIVDSSRKQTDSAVRSILTSAQQERYDSMLRARDLERQRMREQGGRGRGDGPSRGFDPGPPRGGMDHDRF